jgi:DNA-binding winged helix-turn-helix (wHTH) protein
MEGNALLRFGTYELDPQSGELRREGALVRLPPQPFKVLWMLAARAGEVVTREEIRQELWGDDTFVDFDGGLNFCINQIRRALRDSAESPRFVHTVPRRGYRFLASVAVVPAPNGNALADTEPSRSAGEPPRAGTPVLVSAFPDEASRSGGPPRYALLAGGALRRRAVEALSVEEMPDPSGLWALATAGPALRAEEAPIAHPPEPRPSEAPVTAPAPAPVLARRQWARWVWPLLLIAALVGLAAIVQPWRSLGAPEFHRITFRRGMVDAARFAPGGNVVYSAQWDGRSGEIFSVRPEAPDSRVLGPGTVVGVAASGENLVLVGDNVPKPSTLARTPAAGGPPRELYERIREADWSRDGSEIALVRPAEGMDVLELPAGQPIYRVGARITHLRISPDGRKVAFLEHPVAEDDGGSVVVVDRAGARTVLSAGWASAEGVAWHPKTGEVWFTAARVGAEAGLHAVSPTGQLRQVAQVPGRLVLHDIAPDGRVLLQRSIPRLELRGVFPGKPVDHDMSWLDYSGITDISPDGRLIVFSESGEGGGAGYSVFLRQTDGSAPVRLGQGRPMTLSPDGRWVISVPLDAPPRIVLLPTGPGDARVLPGTGLGGYVAATWFPDNRRILLSARSATGEPRVYVQDIEGGPPRLVSGDGIASARVLSPDGKQILLWRLKKSDAPFSILPLDGGPETPVTVLRGNERPLAWSPDGLSVITRRGGRPLVVERVTLATGEREVLHEISPADGAGAQHIGWVSITPDGTSYGYSFHRTLSDLYVVEGLR